MTVTVEKLKACLLAWFESEVVAKVGGLSKWVLEAGALMALPQRVDGALPSLKAMGMMSEDGLVDVTKLHKLFCETVKRAGNVKQDFLGTDITFTSDDVESLFQLLRAQ